MKQGIMVEDNIKALAEAHEACEQRLAQLTEQALAQAQNDVARASALLEEQA